MKVLHVSFTDLSGRRFNGYDLIDDLKPLGIECSQAVLDKQSNNPNVTALLQDLGDKDLQDSIANVEARHSMNGLLYPWGRVLTETPAFIDADVVHYHQIHNGVISLLDLPGLMRRKPSVWTLHEPWVFTGHCVHPMECESWLDGCKGCPRLDLHFPMRNDCAAAMWKIKKRVFSEIDVDVIVASQYMMNYLDCSPLAREFEHRHLIPFGIKEPGVTGSSKESSREALGINPQDFVVLLRATDSEYKGLEYVRQAFALRPPRRPTTLLTVEHRGLLRELSKDYRVVDYGWVQNAKLYSLLLSACDVLLMPSTAEAFGMMALEAMAAGRPVVSFEGTAIPYVTGSPDCGIAVPMRDSTALRDALDALMADPADLMMRGEKARELARTEHAYDKYVNRLSEVYDAAAMRRRREGQG